MKIARLDTDQNQQYAIRYGISAIPAMLLFVDGQVVQSVFGPQSKAAIMKHFAPHLAS